LPDKPILAGLVSSFDQNPDRQLEQVEVGRVFNSPGRYGRCNRLSVLYFPFSEGTSKRFQEWKSVGDALRTEQKTLRKKTEPKSEIQPEILNR
jgi:hypothetical protein